jgi:flavin-dependent thymidylate synthase
MNNNTVELLGYYGCDQVIAQSAWTSTTRDLTTEKIERIPNLLVQLWSQGHETPYEKATVHFLVNCDIASHIHLLKHRISSVNAESARYKELKEDKFYLPEDWNIKMSDEAEVEVFGQINTKENKLTWLDYLEDLTRLTNQAYHNVLKDLTPVLGRKRAKESARYFKTYNSQIQADITFNLRSFANFLRLRNSEHAQLEIREIAQQMQDLVEQIDDKPFKTAMWVITRANELWIKHQEEISKQLIEEFKNVK